MERVEWVRSMALFQVGAGAALLRLVAVWAFGRELQGFLAARKV